MIPYIYIYGSIWIHMDPYGTDMYDIICMDLGKRSFSHRVNQPCSTLDFFGGNWDIATFLLCIQEIQ